ncbi:uncharacterized protein LOC142010868 [Carettochelys insculpta]|uniref:uncharacterized protein LOC142010868 n=1 Tax=Carettochelys insculpta TaxID=44489 RepID=UPI003EB9AB61
MEAPALGLSDITKPFQLYVHERKGVALGILTQKVGNWKRPVAYFSKQIDTVARGWPACLWAVAAAAIVLEEGGKLTLGGEVEVNIPHAVQALLEAKGGLWLTQARLTKYQVSLLENAEVKLVTSPTLNPATLLPEKGTEEIEHDCLETIDTQYSSRPDLKDQPLLNADLEWFTDGSSQVINGKRRAEYAIVSLHETIEALVEELAEVRQGVLQNRMAIDYLLLRHNHGCAEFEGLCCFNLTDKSQTIESRLSKLRELATHIKQGPEGIQWWNWGLGGWLNWIKSMLSSLVVIIVIFSFSLLLYSSRFAII